MSSSMEPYASSSLIWLGTTWISFYILSEQETADMSGIPYKKVMQAASIPIAYTIGTEFKPAPREPIRSMVHWNTW
jgi:hypothetical protein